MTWQLRNRTLDLHARGSVMGVLNVTPDSFSDAGAFIDLERAVAHALAMIAEGAEIIDIGGESTRPGAEPVSAAEEKRRVLPVIERLAPRGVFLSIDTMKPEVAEAALDAGAAIVNDVGGLRDPAMREVVRASGAGAIIMHMQGTPRDMQRAPAYADVVQEVRQFFRQQEAACITSGVDPQRLAFDPGIGFGKTVAHNRALLAQPGRAGAGGPARGARRFAQIFSRRSDRLARDGGPRLADGGADELCPDARRARGARA